MAQSRTYIEDVAWFSVSENFEAEVRPTSASLNRGVKLNLLSLYDCRQLEAAHRHRLVYPSASSVILLDSGLLEADLRRRELRPVYWKEPTYKLLRGRWFWRHNDGTYVPYPEYTSEQIEALWRDESEGSFEKPMPLLDSVHSLIKSKSPKPSSAESDNTTDKACEHDVQYNVTLKQVRNDGSGNVRPVTNQYPELVALAAQDAKLQQQTEENIKQGLLPPVWPVEISAVPPPLLSQPIKHLVLVVHGMGEHYWSVKFQARVLDFQRSLYSVMFTNGKHFQRIQVLPVDWWQVVHSTTFHERIRQVTQPTLPPLLRGLTHSLLADVLFYLSSPWHERIITCVTQQLNYLHRTFIRLHPEVSLHSTSLVGHSLGSLILFDILSNQPASAWSSCCAQNS